METYSSGRQLDALGDPTRRAIFELVATRPRAVVELAERFPISRPAVSQHLRVLKDAGLVTDRAEGTRRVYQLHAAGVASLRAYFDQFWTDALRAFQRDAEASYAKSKKKERTR